LDGVILGDGEEEIKLLSDIKQWVVKEDQVTRRLRSGLVFILRLLGKFNELFDGVLLIEGLVGKLLSVFNGLQSVSLASWEKLNDSKVRKYWSRVGKCASCGGRPPGILTWPM
jgi:hypothetical protein